MLAPVRQRRRAGMARDGHLHIAGRVGDAGHVEGGLSARGRIGQDDHALDGRTAVVEAEQPCLQIVAAGRGFRDVYLGRRAERHVVCAQFAAARIGVGRTVVEGPENAQIRVEPRDDVRHLPVRDHGARDLGILDIDEIGCPGGVRPGVVFEQRDFRVAVDGVDDAEILPGDDHDAARHQCRLPGCPGAGHGLGAVGHRDGAIRVIIRCHGEALRDRKGEDVVAEVLYSC